MHATTIKIIHWIWSEPKLADFMREIAAGEKIPPHGEEFDYGDQRLAAWASDFIFPEDRLRGIKAWERITGRSEGSAWDRAAGADSEARVTALYENLTEGRKTPYGRMAWMGEVNWNQVRDALLGHEGDSDIYVHATAGRFHPANRYRVHDKGTVYESGWTAPSGAWGLPESDRQVCPVPIGETCSCVVQREC